MNETTRRCNGTGWMCLGIVLLFLTQGMARFAVRPAVGFVLDDWAFWAQAEEQESLEVAFMEGLKSPTRPMGCLQQCVFHLFRGRVAAYDAMAIIGYSISLLLVFLLTSELTGRLSSGFVAGLLFAVLPNLCGHFHWLCLIAGQSPPFFLASAWLMARHLRHGGRWTLLASTALYTFGIAGYEIGIFLPAAYAMLLWQRGWKRMVASLLPFGVALAAYAAWRLTAGFGWAGAGVAPQFTPGLSAYAVKHTAADIGSWWGGLAWWRAVGFGAMGFSELPWKQAGGLLAANAALLAASWFWLRKTASRDERSISGEDFGTATLVCFATVWVASTYLPAFLGYFAPRLNYLPGVGVAFLAVLALERIRMDRWLVPLLLLAFAGMVVAEGDTKNWSDTIRFQRNLFETMKDRREEWEGAEILWLDTRQLSQRLTPGILVENRHHIDTVAEYRNTGLLRGFGPSAMARLVLNGQPGPQVILDVECGAKEEDGVLKWHERYNPEQPRETPMERVYRLDALAAGTATVQHKESW